MAQSLITESISLIVVNNALEYDKARTLHGDSLFTLVQNVYPKGLPSNTYLYWQQWDSECDVTPQNESDIEAINQLTGTFYLVTYPAGPETWIPILISVAISVAAAFLMPMPVVPNGAASQPPSPNNALAQRTNRQRLGGRVPDIYGTVWALPDLLSDTYSVYINHDQVEYSLMCLGRGYFNIAKALDDTTPVNQVRGATVLAFDPNTTLNDTQSHQFGQNLTADEVNFSRLVAKRYSSVNGQALPPPDDYLRTSVIFKNPNIIETSDNNIDFTLQFQANGALLVESANDLLSGNNVKDASNNTVKYTLSGSYTVQSVTKSQIILSSPEANNPDWQKLIDNVDFANASDVTLSTKSDTLWQGWFYTDLTDHTDVIVNLRAPNGLYWQHTSNWRPVGIYFEIESELVDSQLNPVLGTAQTKQYIIKSRSFEKYAGTPHMENTWLNAQMLTNDDDVRRPAAMSIFVSNPNFAAGNRLRWRIRRVSNKLKPSDGTTPFIDDVKVSDFYGIRPVANWDIPQGITTIYTKTTATEGALSIKERKLRLNVQRYLRDWQGNDALILSNRIDDIVYNIATDPIIGGLAITDLNMAQIKAEIDAQIAHFGTDKCAEYSGTFDSTDVTTEEMLQTVAQAGFCQAYRINNQIHLNFEKPTDYPIVQFNAHNIAPESYNMSESFGARNDYDGVQVTYTDPIDDARVTLDYPADKSATNPQKVELTGVGNKTQAHIHMMRSHWKNQLANKSCELVGLDESGIVIPTNRIDVADIYNGDVQQGVVVAQTVDNGKTVLTLSEPVTLATGQQATIFVQTMTGIVDNIACVIGSDSYTVVLSRPPVQALSLSYDAVVQATYRLVTHSDFDRDSYIVTAKEPSDNPLSHRLTCINYDDRYYQNDTDYKNNLIS